MIIILNSAGTSHLKDDSEDPFTKTHLRSLHLTYSVPPSLSQAAWKTGACVLGGVLEKAFGAEVCREGASELGLYCDHLLDNR